ncbi:universal stress protein [Spirosoma arcticum]
MKKILLLTDLSEASHNALQFARSFFSDTLVDFHLLCAHPVESGSQHNPLLVVETPRSACADQLTDVVSKLRREATNDWHTFRSSACPGQWIEVVQRSLEAEVYDFVVIGTNADDTNGSFSNGAIALMRQLKANALVVPLDARAGLMRQVVLAADFGNLDNAKLLSPVKDLVTLKGAVLVLLTIDTPGKDIIYIEREAHIRQFLAPVVPTIARLQADSAKQGIDTYLAGHPVDLLVTIPHRNGGIDALAGNDSTHAQPFSPPVLLLTLYDDGSDDHPQPINELLAMEYAH